MEILETTSGKVLCFHMHICHISWSETTTLLTSKCILESECQLVPAGRVFRVYRYINKLPADDAIFALLRERFQEATEKVIVPCGPLGHEFFLKFLASKQVLCFSMACGYLCHTYVTYKTTSHPGLKYPSHSSRPFSVAKPGKSLMCPRAGCRRYGWSCFGTTRGCPAAFRGCSYS